MAQEAPTSTTSHGGNPRSFSGSSYQENTRSSRKRKRHATRSPNDESQDSTHSDHDGDGHRGRRPLRLCKYDRGRGTQRIAGPYFKRNPHGQARADACFRSGFRDISKMKEHLERVHDCSIQCPRCFTVFKDAAALNSHLLVPAREICVRVQGQSPADGFDATQASKLKERMRSQSLEQKWKIIWGILFPLDREEQIPSPWWVDRDELQGIELYNRYESFVREHLPGSLVPRLENLAEDLHGELPSFHERAAAVVQTSLEDVHQAFRQSGDAAPTPTTGQAPQPPHASPPDAGAPTGPPFPLSLTPSDSVRALAASTPTDTNPDGHRSVVRGAGLPDPTPPLMSELDPYQPPPSFVPDGFDFDFHIASGFGYGYQTASLLQQQQQQDDSAAAPPYDGAGTSDSSDPCASFDGFSSPHPDRHSL